MLDVTHPLELNTTIQAKSSPCSCKGPNAPMEHTTGKIQKIINNHSGIWYFLSSGKTVRSDWVEKIIS